MYIIRGRQRRLPLLSLYRLAHTGGCSHCTRFKTTDAMNGPAKRQREDGGGRGCGSGGGSGGGGGSSGGGSGGGSSSSSSGGASSSDFDPASVLRAAADAAALPALRQAFAASAPFRHVTLRPFVDDVFLQSVQSEAIPLEYDVKVVNLTLHGCFRELTAPALPQPHAPPPCRRAMCVTCSW
jgi:hypothetical protein